MEMGLGLVLGLILGGGVKRDQALIYFAALLPLWIGLVLCGSRGGLVAMMAQLVVAALLFSVVGRRGRSSEPHSRLLTAHAVVAGPPCAYFSCWSWEFFWERLAWRRPTGDQD